jgi:hypothetical protein
MFNAFFNKTYNKISFEDIQHIINKSKNVFIINTLPNTEQECLIYKTISYETEENTINELLTNYDFTPSFILYGKNCNDNTVEKKANQLNGLGFSNIYVYSGGLFEWLLLQDIYGQDEFPTTTRFLDILKFKPPNIL